MTAITVWTIGLTSTLAFLWLATEALKWLERLELEEWR